MMSLEVGAAGYSCPAVELFFESGQLGARKAESIRAEQQVYWRLLCLDCGDDCNCGLPRVARLLAIAVQSRLADRCKQRVIIGQFRFATRHRAASPVGTEHPWLDSGHADAETGHFFG